MPDEVTVVATFKIKPEHEDEAVAILSEVVEKSHGEDGCVKYTLHKANNQPHSYAIVERWRSQADLDAHFRMPYMARIADAIGMAAEPAQILFCSPVPLGDGGKGTI